MFTSDFLPPDEAKLQEVLHHIDFLSHLKPEELSLLTHAMVRRTYQKGAYVIKEGGKGYTFFVVISGRLSVLVEKDGKSELIDIRRAGQYFGEMALVGDHPRLATVKAEDPCELFELSKEAFQKILMANPGIAKAVNETISRRKDILS
jgi:CRP-like cAMP-binding protein